MTKLIYIGLILVVSLFAVSCDKDDDMPQDLKNTQIKIIKPVENLTIIKGDTIKIEAEVTSDVSMHGYEIIIHDLATKTQQSILDKHAHGNQLLISHSLITTNETSGEKEIEVVAIIDHTGLKTSARRKFTIK